MKNNKNDRTSSRPSVSRDADSRAGDEGLDEDMSASSSSSKKLESSPRKGRSSNVRTDDVRDLNSIDRTTTRQRESGSSSSESFEGQGGQQGGSRGSEQGTGYTSDRSSNLREDDSRSGGSSKRSSGSEKSVRSSSSERLDQSGSDRLNTTRDIDRSKM